MSNLEKIVESIRMIKKKNYKGAVSYKIEVKFKAGVTNEISVPNDDIQLIKVLKTLGNEEPIKSFTLVKETTETGTEYYCVNVELCDDTVLKYFFPNFNTKKMIDLLVSNEDKNKVNDSKK